MQVKLYRAEDTSVFAPGLEYDNTSYKITAVYLDGNLVPKDRYVMVDDQTVSFIRAIPVGTKVTANMSE